VHDWRQVFASACQSAGLCKYHGVKDIPPNTEVNVRQLNWIAASFLSVCCLCMAARMDAANEPPITSFRADVTVRKDSTLDVREEIVVNNASSYYKRGFLRNLPISATDRWDPRYVDPFKLDNGVRVDILQVTEDGQPARYEQGRGYFYPQLYIGDRSVPVDSGEHRFVIHYTVDYALNPGAARDTLYWNAVGHNFYFPVAEATLTVHLPEVVVAENVQAEPRIGGLRLTAPRLPGTELERLDDSNGTITYRATNLRAHQSLSVVITWPVGAIHHSKFGVLQRDGWILAAPALLFLYYLIAWFRIGPDPKPDAILTRYEPPEGLSPAAARYIATGTTDGRSFAAVIAQLAVRGCLRVESSNGKYKLSRLMSDRATESALAPEEKRILALLFEDGPSIEFTAAMDERTTAQNSRYISHIHDELTKELGKKYFTRHVGIIALGVVITFLFVLPIALTARGRDTTGVFMFTFWILFCGLMIGTMIEVSMLSAFKGAARARSGWKQIFPGIFVVGAFGAIIGFMLVKLAAGVSISYVLMLVAFLLINLGWGPQLKRKTPLGRESSDQIAGFRQFLLKVEQDRLDRLGAPGDAPEDLQRHIPYAIALEVKEAWGDHLSQIFLGTVVYTEG